MKKAVDTKCVNIKLAYLYNHVFLICSFILQIHHSVPFLLMCGATPYA